MCDVSVDLHIEQVSGINSQLLIEKLVNTRCKHANLKLNVYYWTGREVSQKPM